MDPTMAFGIAKGALSIFSGMAENRARKEAATKQYNANKLFIERDQAVMNENLQFAGNEINNQLGMALTDLAYQADAQQATIAAKRAETNVYGNVAVRQQAVARMKEELAEDRLIQQGEAQMTDLQAQLTQVKYQTEARHAQNAQAYNNVMAQQSSTFDIVAGGVGVGISGYSQGMTLASQQAALKVAQTGVK